MFIMLLKFNCQLHGPPPPVWFLLLMKGWSTQWPAGSLDGPGPELWYCPPGSGNKTQTERRFVNVSGFNSVEDKININSIHVTMVFTSRQLSQNLNNTQNCALGWKGITFKGLTCFSQSQRKLVCNYARAELHLTWCRKHMTLSKSSFPPQSRPILRLCWSSAL